MGYLILGAVSAAAIAALVLALRGRQKAIIRAKTAEARAKKTAEEMLKLKEAYYEEAQRLEDLATGSDSDRFAASIDILRNLSSG